MIMTREELMYKVTLCFRLLNSEIGNDPRTNALPIIEAGEVFVSLTRR